MDYVKMMRTIVKGWKRKYPTIIITGEILKKEVKPSNLIQSIDFAFDNFFMQYNFEEGKEIVFVELKNGIERGISYFLNSNFDIAGWYNWRNFSELYVDERLRKDIKDYDGYMKSMYRIHDRLLHSMETIMTSERVRDIKLVGEHMEPTETERKNKKVKKKPPIYMLSDIIEYVHENGLNKEVLHKEINCPCWSVRGHYRHYKNGKTVFIKPYLKGKNKGSDKAAAKKYYV